MPPAVPSRPRRRLLGVAAAILAAGSLATACGSSADSAGSRSTDARGAATAAPAVTMLAAGSVTAFVREHAADAAFVTLDVRTADEFAAGHLSGATNLDFRAADFEQRLSALDRAATYLVYCHSGNRSGQATALMRSLGFGHVYDVQGGTIALEQAGVPLVR